MSDLVDIYLMISSRCYYKSSITGVWMVGLSMSSIQPSIRREGSDIKIKVSKKELVRKSCLIVRE